AGPDVAVGTRHRRRAGLLVERDEADAVPREVPLVVDEGPVDVAHDGPEGRLDGGGRGEGRRRRADGRGRARVLVLVRPRPSYWYSSSAVTQGTDVRGAGAGLEARRGSCSCAR
ncbi:hypothetical protein THAOC_32431, partial [Thalassiosira oceanica]